MLQYRIEISDRYVEDWSCPCGGTRKVVGDGEGPSAYKCKACENIIDSLPGKKVPGSVDVDVYDGADNLIKAFYCDEVEKFCRIEKIINWWEACAKEGCAGD